MLRFSAIGSICLLIVCLCNSAWAVNQNSNDSKAVETQETFSNIPYKQSEEISSATYLRVGAIFIFVLVLATLAILLLKKMILDKKLIKFPGSRIKLLEAKRISSKLSLFLIMVDEKEYLLSQAGDSSNLVTHETAEPHREKVEIE